MKRVEAHRGRDGTRGGEVSTNKGIMEKAGKGSRGREIGQREVKITRKCTNGKREEKGVVVFVLVIKRPKQGEPQLVGHDGGLGARRQYY